MNRRSFLKLTGITAASVVMSSVIPVFENVLPLGNANTSDYDLGVVVDAKGLPITDLHNQLQDYVNGWSMSVEDENILRSGGW